jgi:hypothetical protein
MKVVAIPDRKEQIEKANVAGKSTFRFDPIRSDNELKIQPDNAHVMERTATITPRSAFVNPISGAIKGNRKTILSLSINTKPNKKNIIRTTPFS